MGCKRRRPTMKKDITIGMDLGDQNHEVYVLDGESKAIEEGPIRCTRAAVETFFGRYPGAVVAMETGTHSGWVSRLALSKGLRPLVGNARKLRAIWSSARKSDARDCQMLARMARFDHELLS